jgi:hypothetical protein
LFIVSTMRKTLPGLRALELGRLLNFDCWAERGAGCLECC